ncbi:T9SS type A sorting domain-containing protein [Hymenobacter algoricola]|uniref:beta strand repeat-containing protein n=1 Tax=Hymenobacter algoricola TaxID=486267 RepID=UPI0031E99F12
MTAIGRGVNGGNTTNSVAATVTINNVAPQVSGKTASAFTGGAALVLDPLSDATDANGNATINANSIVLTSATGTASGSFAVGTGGNAGKVVFTPGATAGTATVSYTVKDTGTPIMTSNAATLTVTVAASPDVFTITGSSPVSGSQIQPGALVTFSVNSGAASADATNVVQKLVITNAPTNQAGFTVLPAGVTYSYDTNSKTGTVTFASTTIMAGGSTTASVSFLVPDGITTLTAQGSSTANNDPNLANNTGTVATLTVNNAPVAKADPENPLIISYRSAGVQINILSNDVAVPGASNAINVASVVLSAQTPQGNMNGTTIVVFGGTFSVNSQGVLSFVPAAVAAFNGTYTSVVDYTVKNSATPAAESNSVRVSVTVTDFAPAALDRVNAALLNTATATTLSPSLTGSDADGDPLTYTITGGLPTSTQGVLAYSGITITAAALPFAVANPALLTFDPAMDYSGRVELTYTASSRAVNNATQTSATAIYTIPVGVANTISGVVFEDVNYGGGTGKSLAASNGIVRPNARVELYNGNDFVTSTLTTATGAYSFPISAAGSYSVRVVSGSVTSSRASTGGTLVPVQTFINGDGNMVGGLAPDKQDAGNGSTMLSGLITSSITPQSVATVSVASGGLAVVDFGFSFDVIVNINDNGQGSLRQFVLNASALENTTANINQRPFSSYGAATGTDFPAGQETSVFMLPNGSAQPGFPAGRNNYLTTSTGAYSAANSRALLTLSSGGLSIAGANSNRTALDGTTQSTLSDSNPVFLGIGGTVGTERKALSQVAGPEVEIMGGNGIANLLTVSGNNSIVRGISLHGGTVAVTATAGVLDLLFEQNAIGTTAFSVALPAANATSGVGLVLRNPTGTLRNNIIAYVGNSGINYSSVGAGGLGYTITGNEFRQNGQVSAGGDNITVADNVGANNKTGPLLIAENYIASSNSSGIQFEIGKLGNNTVRNNTIIDNGNGGLSSSRLEGSGIHYLSRVGDAAEATAATNTDLIEKNILTRNQSSGIVINHTQKNVRISQNSIFENGNRIDVSAKGLLSIDFTVGPNDHVGGNVNYGQGDGVTANDGAFSADQPNGGIDYPILTSIFGANNQLRVTGYVGSAPGQTIFGGATVEIYTANNGDTNQDGPMTTAPGSPTIAHGETQSYFGTLTADANGNFDVTFSTVGTNVRPGDNISATAYLTTYGTSEAGTNQLSSFTVLPVELSVFTAKAAGTNAQLSWSTASEKNNDHFTVERSFSGTEFTSIGTVKGHGTSTQAHTYSFTDAGIGTTHTGTIYYRLQQVDTDGTTASSPVRVVRFDDALTAKLLLYPNPATDQTTLDLTTLAAGNYQVTVVDMTGRTLSSGAYAGGALHALKLQAVPKGTYIVLVRGLGSKFSQKLIKE